MFGHDSCFNGRLDTFSRFSAFKIHNSVSLWVETTRKPNGIGRPSLCFARKQSSNSATGCDVINRWIIGTRNFAKSWAPPWPHYTSFWIFWSGIEPFCFCKCLIHCSTFDGGASKRTVGNRVDGDRRSTFVSVNPFFKSLERWERSSWLQILQTACLPSSFYDEF